MHWHLQAAWYGQVLQSGQKLGLQRSRLGTAAQMSLYQRGVQLDGLRVLSTTTTVPQASSGTCTQGSINGICIGAAMHACRRPLSMRIAQCIIRQPARAC